MHERFSAKPPNEARRPSSHTRSPVAPFPSNCGLRSDTMRSSSAPIALGTHVSVAVDRMPPPPRPAATAHRPLVDRDRAGGCGFETKVECEYGRMDMPPALPPRRESRYDHDRLGSSHCGSTDPGLFLLARALRDAAGTNRAVAFGSIPASGSGSCNWKGQEHASGCWSPRVGAGLVVDFRAAGDLLPWSTFRPRRRTGGGTSERTRFMTQ